MKNSVIIKNIISQEVIHAYINKIDGKILDTNVTNYIVGNGKDDESSLIYQINEKDLPNNRVFKYAILEVNYEKNTEISDDATILNIKINDLPKEEIKYHKSGQSKMKIILNTFELNDLQIEYKNNSDLEENIKIKNISVLFLNDSKEEKRNRIL